MAPKSWGCAELSLAQLVPGSPAPYWRQVRCKVFKFSFRNGTTSNQLNFVNMAYFIHVFLLLKLTGRRIGFGAPGAPVLSAGLIPLTPFPRSEVTLAAPTKKHTAASPRHPWDPWQPAGQHPIALSLSCSQPPQERCCASVLPPTAHSPAWLQQFGAAAHLLPKEQARGEESFPGAREKQTPVCAKGGGC